MQVWEAVLQSSAVCVQDWRHKGQPWGLMPIGRLLATNSHRPVRAASPAAWSQPGLWIPVSRQHCCKSDDAVSVATAPAGLSIRLLGHDTSCQDSLQLLLLASPAGLPGGHVNCFSLLWLPGWSALLLYVHQWSPNQSAAQVTGTGTFPWAHQPVCFTGGLTHAETTPRCSAVSLPAAGAPAEVGAPTPTAQGLLCWQVVGSGTASAVC